MKKLLLIFFSLIFVSSVLSCVDNNDFDFGNDIEICSGVCKYQNFSNLSEILDCDDSIKSYLTLSYPNGTLVFSRQEMTREDNFFKFNASSYNLLSSVYNARIDSYQATKGWSNPTDFYITISSTQIISLGSGAYPSLSLSNVAIDVEAIKQEVKQHTKRWLFALFLLSFLVFGIYTDMKKKKIKNLAQEVVKVIKGEKK